MGRVEHAPFDPSDPFDAMSEMFRRQVIDMVLQAEGVTLYRELDPQRQIECFVAGALTGLICACLASVKPEGYDAITEYVASCIPMARTFADNIEQSASDGELTESIAARYEVEKSTIRRILRGETWRHLPRPSGLPRRIGAYSRTAGRALLASSGKGD